MPSRTNQDDNVASPGDEARNVVPQVEPTPSVQMQNVTRVYNIPDSSAEAKEDEKQDTGDPIATIETIEDDNTSSLRSWKQSPTVATCVALGVSVVAVAIGLALLLVSKPWTKTSVPEEESFVNSINQTTAIAYWISLRQLVNGDSWKPSPLIPGSAQWQALTWLVRSDPLAPLPMNSRLVQRYALAVLYYSWDGPHVWSLTTHPEHGWFQNVGAGSDYKAPTTTKSAPTFTGPSGGILTGSYAF